MPATNLYLPQGVSCSHNKLIIADTQHHRVLIWNSLPTQTGLSPDIVVGQIDMSQSSANMGSAVSGATLSAPNSVCTNGTNLVVADSGNDRVLIWDTLPTSNGASATRVLGQSSLTATNTYPDGHPPTADSINSISSVFCDGNVVWTSESTPVNRVKGVKTGPDLCAWISSKHTILRRKLPHS